MAKKRREKAAKERAAKAAKAAKVTGKNGMYVGTGKNQKLNVTKEQLKASGGTLNQYANYMKKNDGKRPRKGFFSAASTTTTTTTTTKKTTPKKKIDFLSKAAGPKLELKDRKKNTTKKTNKRPRVTQADIDKRKRESSKSFIKFMTKKKTRK